MPSLQLFASTLYFVTYLMAFLSGVAYINSPRFLPFHTAVSGKTWDDLDPRMQTLLQLMIRVMGAGMLAVGVCGAALAVLSFGVDEEAIRYIVPLPGVIFGIPAFWATWSVKRATGVVTPYRGAAAVIIVPVAALILRLI